VPEPEVNLKYLYPPVLQSVYVKFPVIDHPMLAPIYGNLIMTTPRAPAVPVVKVLAAPPPPEPVFWEGEVGPYATVVYPPPFPPIEEPPFPPKKF
jgi:hypothetical protein